MLLALGIVVGLWLLWGLGVLGWCWLFQDVASEAEEQAMTYLEDLGDDVGDMADSAARLVYAFLFYMPMLPIVTLFKKWRGPINR